jgi:hypothetical protein
VRQTHERDLLLGEVIMGSVKASQWHRGPLTGNKKVVSSSNAVTAQKEIPYVRTAKSFRKVFAHFVQPGGFVYNSLYVYSAESGEIFH